MTMTRKRIEGHLATLRMACDPVSPFYRKVDFGCKGGLLTLPVSEQQEVFDAIPPALMAMVEEAGLPYCDQEEEGR